MGDMMYPQSEEEYASLRDQGKTVEYAESLDAETQPAGEGWSYWGNCVTDEGSAAVWRRIVPISD